MDYTAISIVAIIFFSIVAVIKIITDNMVRRKLAEKGMVSEEVKYLYADTLEFHRPGSLKWGMVLIAIGLAILIGQLLPYKIADELTISAMFIFAGLALILYYFIAGRLLEISKKEDKKEG